MLTAFGSSNKTYNSSDAIVPVWNSAFKIIEAPMSFTNKLQNAHGRWYEIINDSPLTSKEWDVAVNQLGEGLKKFNFTEVKLGARNIGGNLLKLSAHLYDKKIVILSMLGQTIAYPISWIFTPLTAIADVVAGVIQAMIRACQGASKKEIQTILHKKFLAAPAQQFAYTINNLVILGPVFKGVLQALAKTVAQAVLMAALAAIYLSYQGYSPSKIDIRDFLVSRSNVIEIVALSIFMHSFFFGDSLYRHAQTMVAKLPKYLIPEDYNIFIENGAFDAFGNKAFDPEGKYAEFKWKFERASAEERDRVERGPFSSIKIDLLQVVNPDPNLTDLREWLISGKESYTLFGFESEEDVIMPSLKSSYKKLSLKCHPDKCPTSSNLEATILFKMLNMARLDVEENIINKR